MWSPQQHKRANKEGTLGATAEFVWGFSSIYQSGVTGDRDKDSKHEIE